LPLLFRLVRVQIREVVVLLLQDLVLLLLLEDLVVLLLLEDLVVLLEDQVEIMAIDGRQPYVLMLHWLNHFLLKFNN
jgi:hypothetical protein